MKIQMPFMDDHLNTKMFYLNSRVGVLDNKTENKVRAEYPGLRNMPLKMNINRLIHCARSNGRLSTPPKVSIPKSLTGLRRCIRVIYECSGLVKGNSLIWNSHFTREPNFDVMKTYIGQSNDDEEITKQQYTQLLTNLWSFLARTNDSDVDYYLLQSLKKALLRDTGKEKQVVEGVISKWSTEPYDDHRFTNLINKVKEKIEDIQVADWTRGAGGMPSNKVEEIHYTILMAFKEMSSDNKDDAVFRYAAYIPKGSNTPQIYQKDVNDNYVYYSFDPNCKSMKKLNKQPSTTEFYTSTGQHDDKISMASNTSNSSSGRVSRSVVGSGSEYEGNLSGGSVITLYCRRRRSKENDERNREEEEQSDGDTTTDRGGRRKRKRRVSFQRSLEEPGPSH